MNRAAPAIATKKLGKRYGRIVALHQLDLEVEQGEIFGFLGLNGAGKTTTIRLLLDLLRPSEGQSFIFGYDCQKRGMKARALIGYLPGELGFYSDMTGERTLDFLARMQGHAIDMQRRRLLQDRLQLDDSHLRRTLREYSTGMKRKLGLIQAFASDAPLLILDEPTEGLDPLMREALNASLREAKEQGRTVFMSSHVLSEVERICHRIALLRQGELVLLSTVDEVRNIAGRELLVDFSADVAFDESLLQPGDRVLAIEPRRWSLRIHGPLGPWIAAFSEMPQRGVVKDLHIREPRLEDVLRTYYNPTESPR